jgi:hypothetical protein
MASSAPSSTTALVAVFTAAALLATTASAHGCMTQPRSRGCLVAGRTFLPQIMDASAPRDYCCQCQNAGGVSITRGGYGSRWTPYEPMTSTRGNFGLCGDPVGNFDHMQGGKFTNPPSMPYVASYAPGGVANFEFDATAGHVRALVLHGTAPSRRVCPPTTDIVPNVFVPLGTGRLPRVLPVRRQQHAERRHFVAGLWGALPLPRACPARLVRVRQRH